MLGEFEKKGKKEKVNTLVIVDIVEIMEDGRDINLERL